MSTHPRSAGPGGGLAAPGEPAHPGADWPRWRVFPPIALGVVMATLDASVVNIALPTLQRAFRSGLSTVEWVALAYSLTMTGLLLSSGRLADTRGRRTVYGVGLAIHRGRTMHDERRQPEIQKGRDTLPTGERAGQKPPLCGQVPPDAIPSIKSTGC